MSDEKCSHWSVETTDDGTKYCAKCNEIVNEIPNWYGNLSIGSLTAYIEGDKSTLSLSAVISKALGTTIVMNDVTVSDFSWDAHMMVTFTIGGKPLFADIKGLRKGIRYEGTGRFYEQTPKLEVVADNE